MEEKLMLIPQIKMGMRVKIKPGTRFYVGSPKSSNPKDVSGSICPGDSSWLSVKWDNGAKNNYEEHDLEFEEPVNMIEVDLNKIYFEDKDLKFSNMDELLWKLYPKGGAVETFYYAKDIDQMISQCKKNRMRSFDDIWIIADTYMPGIDVKDVFIGLLLFNTDIELVMKGFLRKSFSNCSTMQRIRFTNSLTDFNNIFYNLNCNKYDSVYSWVDLFNMIGVKTSDDLKNWYIEQLKVKV